MLTSTTMINVVNKRSTSYTATIRGEYYEWLPARNGIEDSIELSFREVQTLHTTSATFRDGYLFIDNEEARKRLGLETEEVKVFQSSRDDIEKALTGNMAQFNKLINTQNRDLLREIIEVAKDIKLSNYTKLQKLSEASGVPVEVITGEE